MLSGVLTSFLAQADTAGVWLPDKMSNHADAVDWVFWYVMWVCVFFFIGIVAAAVIFAVKYHRKPTDHPADVKGPTHNTPLEITWTVIPPIIVIYMFWVGVEQYTLLQKPPPNAYVIDVEAQKWSWKFIYPNGVDSPNLHVVKGRPTYLRMTSNDVLHAFFAPSMRVKMDVIPGRISSVWFTPIDGDFEFTTMDAIPDGPLERRWTGRKQQGAYHIFCAEYCGTQHSMMYAKLFIHANEDSFNRWLVAVNVPPEGVPAVKGEWLWRRKGCNNCHSIDGTPGIGPSWLETSTLINNKQNRTFQDGSSALADYDYIRASIQKPGDRLVAGNYQKVMPNNRLSEEQIRWIYAYIESLVKSGQ